MLKEIPLVVEYLRKMSPLWLDKVNSKMKINRRELLICTAAAQNRLFKILYSRAEHFNIIITRNIFI